jgi:hypothetical protein
MSRNRSGGRNARRKLARSVEKQSSKLLPEAAYFSAAGNRKTKDSYLADVRSLQGQLRWEIAELRLGNWRQDLGEASSRLGAPGCWEIYHLHLSEARALGVEPEFREMVARAASKFLGRTKSTLVSGNE